MIKKFADDKHKEQAETYIFSVGNFVIEFERVCDGMRAAIMCILLSQGLSNHGMAQVLIGDKASADLQLLLGALFSQIPDKDEDDRSAVKELLKHIKELTEKRNVLLHSNWQFGSHASEGEFYASTLRYRVKQNSEASAEIIGFSASRIELLCSDAKRIQALLGRLGYCIRQIGFKVSTELNKAV